eukprot:4242604-Lingulodinium_polyedra.AAC.1
MEPAASAVPPEAPVQPRHELDEEANWEIYDKLRDIVRAARWPLPDICSPLAQKEKERVHALLEHFPVEW